MTTATIMAPSRRVLPTRTTMQNFEWVAAAARAHDSVLLRAQLAGAALKANAEWRVMQRCAGAGQMRLSSFFRHNSSTLIWGDVEDGRRLLRKAHCG